MLSGLSQHAVQLNKRLLTIAVGKTLVALEKKMF